MSFQVLRKTGMAVLLFAGIFGGYSAGAAEPASGQNVASTSFYREVNHSYSFFDGSSGSSSERSESTLCFDDGFGKFTEFRMTWENRRMILEVRQNGRLIGRKSCYTENSAFSVTRDKSGEQTYFLITMGDHRYRGEFDRDNRWTLTEKEDGSPNKSRGEENGTAAPEESFQQRK